MADSLDDFFARKDRAKKSKGKKAQSEDPSIKPDDCGKEKRKEKEKQAEKQPAPLPSAEEDSDWKEVDYEKDYSGLKIHSMTIRDKEDEMREQKLQEATEQLESKKNESSGPWKTSASESKSAAEVPAVRPSVKKESDSVAAVAAASAKVSTGGKYVPPNLRNQPQHDPSQPLQPVVASKLRSSRPSKAPEIENQMEFPSLGADASPVVEPKPIVVETVSNNSWREPATTRIAVKTENKFDALRED